MPLQRNPSGGGAALGDYLQTEASALADGKALLTLDGSLLNSGTYPQLAAIFGDKYKLKSNKPIVGSSNVSPAGSWSFVTDNKTLYFTIGDAQALLEGDNTTTERTTSTLVSVSAGYYPYDVCASKDGQYITFLARRLSDNNLYVWWSDDFGSSFSSQLIASDPSSGLTPVASCNNPYRIMCNANHSVVRVAYADSDGVSWNFYESIDHGATWSQIWVGVVTGYPSLTNHRGEWSDDASTYVVMRSQTSLQSFIVRNGVKTNIAPFKAWSESNAGMCSISGDGLRIGYSLIEPMHIKSYQSPFFYTDDDGATWNEVVIDFYKVNETSTGSGTNRYIQNTMSTLAFSRVNKDYGYMVVTSIIAATEQIPRLIRIHLPTGNYEVIGDLMEYNTIPLTNAFNLNIACQLHSDGKTDLVSISSAAHALEIYQFGYDQFLIPPSKENERLPLKIVADAP